MLTAALALVGNLFYVLVYTRWLKRSTPQNIVIGGAAGAVPPLVGWAAATGNLTLPALVLFADRLLLDAAALLGARAADQARLRGGAGADAAGRPRRPRDDAADRALLAGAGRRQRSRRSPAARSASVYLVAALAARGRVPLARASAAARDDAAAPAMLFHYSLLYLALLFVSDGRRRGDLDERSGRWSARTPLWGWALLGDLCVLFAGTVAVAFIYLALD